MDMPTSPEASAPTLPERSAAVRRSAARLCLRLGWAPVHEVPLPNGRRADILALSSSGAIVCIEIKSGERDFLTDGKWTLYRDFCDELYFAVDTAFPQSLLPGDVGLIVASPPEADILRPAAPHPVNPARRRAVTQRLAWLAASRLAARDDPAGMAECRSALRPE